MLGFGLEALAPFARRGDGRVKYACVPVHDAGLPEPRELVPRDGPDGACLVPEVHAAPANEGGPESGFQIAQAPEEPVNGAPRRVGVGLIDGDHEEPVVPPLTRDGERLTVRPPLR